MVLLISWLEGDESGYGSVYFFKSDCIFFQPLVLTQLFPPECCDNSCKIPPQKICREDTHPADDGSKLFIEIVISEVYSPTRFYFNLRSKVPSLNAMMDDLE